MILTVQIYTYMHCINFLWHFFRNIVASTHSANFSNVSPEQSSDAEKHNYNATEEYEGLIFLFSCMS